MSTEGAAHIPNYSSDSGAMAPASEGEVSLLRLLGLTSFMFATGLLLSTYGMITLALESARLAPTNSSFALAGFLAMAGVSQLVCPLAGYLSDRHESRCGRRVPFIAGGTTVLVLGLAVQWVSRSGELPGVGFDDDDDDAASSSSAAAADDDDGASRFLATVAYGSAFLASMIALNVAYTAATSLVPDLVPPEQTGIANGLGVFLQVLGSCFGFLYYFLVDDLDALYALYVVVVVCFAGVTLIVALPKRRRRGRGSKASERKPFNDAPPSPGGHGALGDDSDPFLAAGHGGSASAKGGPEEPFSWAAIASCYYVNPRDPETRDFFYVFVSRTLYYTGGSVQAFLVYYLRDRLDDNATGTLDTWLLPYVNTSDPARSTCVLALAGYVSGVVAAVPAGALSDRAGRKPVVVFACVLMSLSMVGLGFSTSPSAIVFWGLLGGLGNGSYQAVDLALAVDTLPNPEESARFMGVWGVGAFVGVCLGPLIGAPLLYVFGQVGDPEPPANGQLGYLALFLYGSLSIFASAAVLLRYVKGAK